ncbi:MULTISPECIES: RraA family protein [Halocynthiibacter]|uniref:Putative 4-hydroxy-4-methyl-2-oxoglutarate aldolase n=1 Tax=Halocynthiibacter halioticoli TaxID=2986804 RepID=A0AAE3IZS1_9RHOB|nr:MULTISPECIES: RraA family protein [Halocynthiibacter]MCV6823501.1 RraA family protein [Halocynthiibacter halioticoli]MCW4056502.1 RraA family protein [Halocynthiibacter sp. SDUM655004]
MNDTLLKLLKQVDTPTVCNAIEVAQGKRGFNDFTRSTMLTSHPDAPAMVGYARTARIAAVAPPTEAPEVIKARRMDYYRHMSEGPRPAIAVVEDVDFPHCIGAFWGEINTTVHKGLGLSGTLTNGVMRDLGDVPDGYPVVAGSIGPSHGFVHVKEIGEPVTIFGMRVADGDLVHADRHGALVIPPEVIPELEAAIRKLLDTESLILEPARKEGFDFEAFEAAWAEFEAART